RRAEEPRLRREGATGPRKGVRPRRPDEGGHRPGQREEDLQDHPGRGPEGDQAPDPGRRAPGHRQVPRRPPGGHLPAQGQGPRGRAAVRQLPVTRARGRPRRRVLATAAAFALAAQSTLETGSCGAAAACSRSCRARRLRSSGTQSRPIAVAVTSTHSPEEGDPVAVSARPKAYGPTKAPVRPIMLTKANPAAAAPPPSRAMRTDQ